MADDRFDGRQDLRDFVGEAIDRKRLSDDLNAAVRNAVGEDGPVRIA